MPSRPCAWIRYSAAAWATLGSIAFQMHEWDKAGDAYAQALETGTGFLRLEHRQRPP